MLIHVRPGTVLELNFTPTGTAGAHADDTASRYGIPGRAFTYKADGVVLDRAELIPANTGLLELIEIDHTDEPTEAGVDDDD